MSKVLAAKAEGPKFNLQNPRGKSSCDVMCLLPTRGEVEMQRGLRLACLPA